MSRYGFVTCGPFSGTNDALLSALRDRLAPLEPEIFDVPSWIRSRRATLTRNLGQVLLEYGPRPFANRERLWGAFYRTSYLFDAVKRAAQERATGGGYAFSLQTQSLFDASAPGVPHFIYTDHTALANRDYPDGDLAPAPNQSWVQRERLAYERAEMIFTMSSHVSRSLVEHYAVPASKVQCVYAGANIALSADPSPPEVNARRVLFVGRDWTRKGGPALLQAFRAVRRVHPQATLAIVGCTPDVKEEGVEVLGELQPEAVEEQYRRSTLFCMPTRREPFGVVFVEALAHGLPVVATAVGAVPDVVQDGETGCLVAPGDTRGLALALTELLGDPIRCRKFGELGRCRVAERYTWPRVAEAMSRHIPFGRPRPASFTS
jgi:glycosyltransferase involved in cell wall biosynthesis